MALKPKERKSLAANCFNITLRQCETWNGYCCDRSPFSSFDYICESIFGIIEASFKELIIFVSIFSSFLKPGDAKLKPKCKWEPKIHSVLLIEKPWKSSESFSIFVLLRNNIWFAQKLDLKFLTQILTKIVKVNCA